MNFKVGDKVIDPNILDNLLNKKTPLKSLESYARVVMSANEFHFSLAKVYNVKDFEDKKNNPEYARNVFNQDGSKIIKSSNNVHMIHFSDKSKLKKILNEKYKNHFNANAVRLARKELKIFRKMNKLNKQLAVLRGEPINEINFEYPQLIALKARKEDINSLIGSL